MKTSPSARPFSKSLLLLSLVAVPIPESTAQVLIYSSRAAFLADAAALASQTLDFESQATGTMLPDPTTLEGITFSGHGLPDLVIDDTYEATSGANYLGINNPGTFNQFSYSDTVTLSFASKNAIGLSIITAEIPGVSLFDDDIRINVPGIGIAGLDADATESLTAQGDRVFFIGLIDSLNGFTSAQLEGSGAVGFYNVDDIITAAVPEPGVVWGIAALSPVLLGACWRRRRAKKMAKAVGPIRDALT